MMPRPSLPKAEEIAGIARLLRAEGFECICIETTPDGRVSITMGEADTASEITPLKAWKIQRGAA